GICRGSRNVLARYYQAIPIGITVEGANILTRTLIVFGQGVLRCHPHAQDEVRAAMQGDLVAFDKAFVKHVGNAASVSARAVWTAVLGGGLSPAAGSAESARLVNGLTRFSAAFAFSTEMAMLTVGGQLKRREALSGRLADCMAWLYFGSAALHRFEAGGCKPEEIPFLRWSTETCLKNLQDSIDGLLRNLPNAFLGTCLRRALFPFGLPYGGPSDELTCSLAKHAMENEATRAMLVKGVHIPSEESFGLGSLEATFQRLRTLAPVRKKLRAGVRARKLARGPEAGMLEAAVEAGVLEAAEASALGKALAARDEQMQVDAFDAEAYLDRCGA
ncbi:MAG: acyl-CoA dehydrogenase, partial [Planctomycetota bacterium]